VPLILVVAHIPCSPTALWRSVLTHNLLSFAWRRKVRVVVRDGNVGDVAARHGDVAIGHGNILEMEG